MAEMRHPSALRLLRLRLPWVFIALPIGAGLGCGESASDTSAIPPTAIARVGDELIPRQQIDSLLPPSARNAGARRALARHVIRLEWVRQEAAREDIAVSYRAAKARLSGTSARTPAEILMTHRSLLLERLIDETGGGPPTMDEIVDYYHEHPREYARPEVRYMRLVVTDSRSQAAAARRALERGRSWKAVISRYSTSKGNPVPPSGAMGAQPGEMPDPLGDALYAARRGVFYGPVQTGRWWYAFELSTIDRFPPQSLARARAALRLRLNTRRTRERRAELQRQLEVRYQPITVCRRTLSLPECRKGSLIE